MQQNSPSEFAMVSLCLDADIKPGIVVRKQKLSVLPLHLLAINFFQLLQHLHIIACRSDHVSPFQDIHRITDRLSQKMEHISSSR